MKVAPIIPPLSQGAGPASYARLSPTDSFLKSVSLPDQLSGNDRLIEFRQLDTPRVYVDPQASATNRRKRRGAFEQLLKDVQTGLVTSVVVRDQDRFLRHPEELEKAIKILQKHNVPVYCWSGPDLDLTTEDGRTTARILVAVARGEVEKKSKRQKNANLQRIMMGQPVGSVAPFGYEYTEDRSTFNHIHVEVKAALWAERYMTKLDGTWTGVAREWNKRGLKTRWGTAWSRVTTKQAMLNPALCGRIAYQPTTIMLEDSGTKKIPAWQVKDTYKGNFKPIMTEKRWRAFRAKVTAAKSNHGNVPKHLGARLYLCGICDDPEKTMFTRYRPKDGRPAAAHRGYGCTHFSVAAQPVDDYVTDFVEGVMSTNGWHARIFGQKKSEEEQADAIAIEETRLMMKLEALAEALANDDLDMVGYQVASKKIKEELEAVRSSETGAAMVAAAESILDEEEVRREWASGDLRSRQKILRHMTTRIAIFPVPLGRLPNGLTQRDIAHRYVHIYDHEGRLWPRPVGDDEHALRLEQQAHLARYDRELVELIPV